MPIVFMILTLTPVFRFGFFPLSVFSLFSFFLFRCHHRAKLVQCYNKLRSMWSSVFVNQSYADLILQDGYDVARNERERGVQMLNRNIQTTVSTSTPGFASFDLMAAMPSQEAGTLEQTPTFQRIILASLTAAAIWKQSGGGNGVGVRNVVEISLQLRNAKEVNTLALAFDLRQSNDVCGCISTLLCSIKIKDRDRLKTFHPELLSPLKQVCFECWWL